MPAITLVLLPGMDGTGEMFASFVAAMGSECNTLCIRYSDDGALGYAELEQLVRVQLPQTGPYVLVGESFSGPIAASLSAAPPPGMVGVVLCCTFLRNPRPKLAVFSGLLRFAPLKEAPAGAKAAVLLGQYSTAALRTALSHALAQVSNDTLRARLRAVQQVDARVSLAAAKVPVLYLQARQDYVVPASAGLEVKASLPAAALVAIAGPHMLLQACPVSAAIEIKRFLQGLLKTTRANSHASP